MIPHGGGSERGGSGKGDGRTKGGGAGGAAGGFEIPTHRFSLYFLFSSSLDGWSMSFTMVNKGWRSGVERAGEAAVRWWTRGCERPDTGRV